MNIILDAVTTSHLHKLRLIACPIGQDSIKHLQTAITKAKYLTCIDLSFSKMTYATSVQVLEVVAKSRKLNDVNLSYATLVENSNFG